MPVLEVAPRLPSLPRALLPTLSPRTSGPFPSRSSGPSGGAPGCRCRRAAGGCAAGRSRAPAALLLLPLLLLPAESWERRQRPAAPASSAPRCAAPAGPGGEGGGGVTRRAGK